MLNVLNSLNRVRRETTSQTFSSGKDPMTPTSSDFPSDESSMSEPDEISLPDYSSPSSSFIYPDDDSYVDSLSSESMFERDEIGEDPMTPTSSDFPSDESMSEPDEISLPDYSSPSSSLI
jgi:hypothetical protein